MVIMDKSTIYLKCPQCRENGLLIERQGKYFCANCMYDYTPLKEDTNKLDEVLLENLKEGGFGPLFASALYERVKLVPPREATEYVHRLAEENGIDLKISKSKVIKSLIPLIILLVVVVVIIIVAFLFITS